jgi:hypothetical protein
MNDKKSNQCSLCHSPLGYRTNLETGSSSDPYFEGTRSEDLDPNTCYNKECENFEKTPKTGETK